VQHPDKEEMNRVFLQAHLLHEHLDHPIGFNFDAALISTSHIASILDDYISKFEANKGFAIVKTLVLVEKLFPEDYSDQKEQL